MKLCFLGDSSSPHVQRWIKYFLNQGHEISLITLSKVKTLPFDGVKLYNLKSYDFFNPIYFIKVWQLVERVKKIIKDLEPDLLHIHQISSLAYIAPLLNFHPYVLSAWGSDILLKPKRKKVYKYLASFTIKNADLLHCDANKMSIALTKLGGDSNKIVRIYFGTDITLFSPKKRNNKLSEKLNVGSSQLVISTRNFRPIYNLESLILSIPIVLKTYLNVKFILVGSGPQDKKLRKLVETLSIDKDTIFSGRLSESELSYFYARSDIYVSTSLSDAGLAASTAEAMSSGLPVIVTDDPDNRLWIKDGINGFIVPKKSPNILAEYIIKLLKNKELRIKMGKKNMKLIDKNNNYYTEMGKMEVEYYRLLNPLK